MSTIHEETIYRLPTLFRPEGMEEAEYSRRCIEACVRKLPEPFCHGVLKYPFGGGASSVVYKLMVGKAEYLLKAMDSRFHSLWHDCTKGVCRKMMCREIGLMRMNRAPHRQGLMPLEAGGCFEWMDEDNVVAVTGIICMKRYRRLVKELAEREFTENELLELAKDYTRKVGMLHRLGFAHRDIKPENIFLELSPNGGWSTVVGDFGGTIDIRGDWDVPLMGTPRYCPPEYKEWLSDRTYFDHLEESDVYAICCSFIRILGGIPRSMVGGDRPVPEYSILGRSFEALLGTCRTTTELLYRLDRVEPDKDAVVPAYLKRAREALSIQTADLDEVYALLYKGCDATEDGCQRLYRFLNLEFSDSEEKKRKAEDVLRTLGERGDPVAEGMYWFYQFRHGDVSQEMLKHLEKSGWPIGLYISGRYYWTYGDNVEIRCRGAELIWEAAQMGLEEARRVIANYIMIYESREIRGLRNYLSEQAEELKDQRFYYNYAIRKKVTDPFHQSTRCWRFWDHV